MVITTVSVVTLLPSETCSANTTSLLTVPSGAMNVGLESVELDRVTLGPAVCTHWNESGRPSAS